MPLHIVVRAHQIYALITVNGTAYIYNTIRFDWFLSVSHNWGKSVQQINVLPFCIQWACTFLFIPIFSQFKRPTLWRQPFIFSKSPISTTHWTFIKCFINQTDVGFASEKLLLFFVVIINTNCTNYVEYEA